MEGHLWSWKVGGNTPQIDLPQTDPPQIELYIQYIPYQNLSRVLCQKLRSCS